METSISMKPIPMAAKKPRNAASARSSLVRELLAARKAHIVPRLAKLEKGHGTAAFNDGVLSAQWCFGTGEKLSLIANLSAQPQPRPHCLSGRPVWGGAPPDELPPWSVFAAIGAR